MIIKKLQFGVSLIAASIILIIVLSSVATAGTCVGAGYLMITSSPSVENFDESLSTSAADVIIEHVFTSPIEVEDSRAETLGFVLSMHATDFQDISGETNDTITVDNLYVMTDSDNILEYDDPCDDGTGISLSCSTYTAFSDSNQDGLSDDLVILEGDVRARVGYYTIYPKIKLVVPGGTLSGTFSTTLTYTLM